MDKLTDEKAIWLYRKMMEIRRFEEATLSYFQKPGHGSHHPSIGNEAIESAVGAVLQPEDYLFCSHRSHGLLLTKGLEPKYVAAELWGKVTGYCHGRGGSMHVTDWSKRVMPSGIVGTNITLATGVGLAIQLQHSKEVAMAVFGDGATNSGAFHEGLNMAGAWHLPVIFLCEDNGLAVSTRLRDSTAVEKLSIRASAYSMPVWDIDGTDPLASYEALSEAVEQSRKTGCPTFVVASVKRWKGHSAWDQGSYLTEDELGEMAEKDPLPPYRRYLVEKKILSLAEIETIDTEMRMKMEEAIRFAEESPAPALTKEEAARYTFA
jgi:TPP-dependent pyruvate/acetoin dehydrogenase alpha subunit